MIRRALMQLINDHSGVDESGRCCICRGTYAASSRGITWSVLLEQWGPEIKEPVTTEDWNWYGIYDIGMSMQAQGTAVRTG